MDEEEQRNLIISTIYDENHYPSIEPFYKLVKQQIPKITKKSIKEFLDKQIEYQLTKTQINKSPDGHIVAFAENDIWQLDIYDMQRYESKNKKFKYILCCIDVFTRKAYIAKMKNKDVNDVLSGLATIFSDADAKPHVFMSDNDSAFLSNAFSEFIDENKIALDYNVLHDHNALGIVDNFAKRIKTILSKHYLRTKDTNWIDVIDAVIKRYNSSPHSSLGKISPNEASQEEHVKEIEQLNILKNVHNKVVSDLSVGDKVRKRITKTFHKGTDDKWSDEIFEVKSIRGGTITLTDGVRAKRTNLLLIPKETEISAPNVIQVAKAQAKQKKTLIKENISADNIKTSARVKKIPERFRE